MIRSFRPVRECGLTLIELVATITVMGLILVGLSLGFRSILLQYEMDHVRNDITTYANTMVGEITKEMQRADSVFTTSRNGLFEIQFWNDNDISPYLRVYGDKEDGFVVEPSSHRLAQVNLRNSGEMLDSKVRTIRLHSFNIEQNSDVRPKLTDFNKALLKMYFVFQIESNLNYDVNSEIENLYIERHVFLPKYYIKKAA